MFEFLPSFFLTFFRDWNLLRPHQQVALCAGYVAVQAELELLVLKLDASSELQPEADPSDTYDGSDSKLKHHEGLCLVAAALNPDIWV